MNSRIRIPSKAMLPWEVSIVAGGRPDLLDFVEVVMYEDWCNAKLDIIRRCFVVILDLEAYGDTTVPNIRSSRVSSIDAKGEALTKI